MSPEEVFSLQMCGIQLVFFLSSSSLKLITMTETIVPSWNNTIIYEDTGKWKETNRVMIQQLEQHRPRLNTSSGGFYSVKDQLSCKRCNSKTMCRGEEKDLK